MRKYCLLILALSLPLLSWAEEEMTIYSELTYLSAAPGAEAALEAALLENDAVVAQAQANARGLFAWALYRVLYHDGAYSHVVIRQAIQREGGRSWQPAPGPSSRRGAPRVFPRTVSYQFSPAGPSLSDGDLPRQRR